ncbi:MAG: response regulator transcription factor [bacterium]|nr:response regulator transcription factor [bacterium]
MTPIRVLIADDHRLFSAGLKQILESSQTVAVIGLAVTGLEAIQMTRDLKPDVILMDISMPEINGIEAVRRIIEGQPDAQIAMLSMHSDRRYVVEAMRAGARGYLLKDSSPDELLTAIKSIKNGQVFLATKIAEMILKEYLQKDPDIASSTAFDVLSPREREVLQLLAEGKSTKKISELLFLSAKTIETHRMHIMDKLNLYSVAELTRYAIREGLSPLD